MIEYSIFTLAWLTEDGNVEWNPDCNISIPADAFINTRDLAAFVEYWLYPICF